METAGVPQGQAIDTMETWILHIKMKCLTWSVRAELGGDGFNLNVEGSVFHNTYIATYRDK